MTGLATSIFDLRPSTWIEIASAIASIIAVSGVILNNHRRRACFVLWWFSNSVFGAIHVTEGLWALAARDVVFFALAVWGFVAWGRKPLTTENTEVTENERTER